MKEIDGGITAVRGIKASGVACGIKEKGKDLALVYSEKPAVFDAVFTTNKVKAAPVVLSEVHAESKIARAVILNSGNANACTGEAGMRDAEAMVSGLAEVLSIPKERVMVASTGVIGVPLPIGKILPAIPGLASSLSKEGGLDAAEAIMTTDMFPKTFAVEEEKGGNCFRVGGIAKGAGMINPNMATMISILATDVKISPKALHKAFRYAVSRSFNRITVDGDMSTNDTAMILATGQSQFGPVQEGTSDFFLFREVLTSVMLYLAKEIVRDGEGATKIILVRVDKAKDFAIAEKVARSVVNSLLVKTAFFGENPNWGRIISAVGASGAELDPGKVDIFINDCAVVKGGEIVSDEEDKDAVSALLNKEITLKIFLGDGNASTEVWSSDISYDYIKINADYKT